jgi:kynureninase
MANGFLLPGTYLCGHSLGPLHTTVQQAMQEGMEQWKGNAVSAWNPTGWLEVEEEVSGLMASLVGAHPEEVVLMNSLTVNLHLLLAMMYRPTAQRYRIVVDSPIFSSDRLAMQSAIRQAGFAAKDAMVALPAGEDLPGRLEQLLRTDDSIALCFFAGVNHLTGELYDMEALTAVARRYGVVIGFDLAHAVGNVPLQLHDWGVDFAVWCCYKYLNGGPGTVGGAFIHSNRSEETALRGWWGDPEGRGEILGDGHAPARSGAGRLRISTPPILNLLGLRAALQLFSSMEELHQRSLAATQLLLEQTAIPVITPQKRGNMVAFQVKNAQKTAQVLKAQQIVCDVRAPDLLRVSYSPLYNTPADIERLMEALLCG